MVALKNDKFCINKKFLMITLILVAIVIIYPFIYSRTSYKSSAAVRKNRQFQTITSLTSDPKKVMNSWLSYVIGKKYPKGSSYYLNQGEYQEVYNYAEIFFDKFNSSKNIKLSNYSFVGELDFTDHYAHAEDACFFASATVMNDPLGFILRAVANDNNYYDFRSKNTRLSFFRSNSNGEIIAFLTSYKIKNEVFELYGMKYIPYSSFLNAFSAVIKKQKLTMTNHIEDKTDDNCPASSIKTIWETWATSIINDVGIKNLSETPFYKENPSKFASSKAEAIQLWPKARYFKAKLEENMKISIPEVTIGPYFSTILKGFTQLNQLNYIIDKCPGPGNFEEISVLKGLEEKYLEKVTTTSNYGDARMLKIISGKTFINYVTTGGNCSTNYYDNLPSSADFPYCPEAVYNIKASKTNTISVVFKALKDDSCKLKSEEDIEFIIYVGE